MKIHRMQRICFFVAKTGLFLLLLTISFLYTIDAKVSAETQLLSRSAKAALTVKTAENGKDAEISWNGFMTDQAASYEVFRSTTKNSGYKKVASSPAKSGTISLTDSNLVRGKTYYYRLDLIKYDGSRISGEPVTYGCPLKQVQEVKLVRYSTSSVKVTWKKVTKAKYYRVYMAKNKNGKYRQIAKTKNLWYRAKGLKNKTDYYFKVQACVRKKSSPADAELSSRKHMKTRTFNRTTIFAGDSITTGLSIYHTIDAIHIGGQKR